MPRLRVVIVASYFLVFVGAGVYLPYFPLYLQHLGLSGGEIGVIVGIQPILRWVAAIGWAYVADRWRIRHPLLVFLAVAGSVFYLPLFWARSFGTVLAVTVPIGLLHGPLLPMLDAIVIDQLDRLGTDYARMRLWGSVAFVVGALGSAPLLDAIGPQVVPILFLLPLLPLGPVLARLPAAQRGHPERFRPPWALVNPPMAAFLGAAFLNQLSSGAWQGFFAVHARTLGLPDSTAGLAYGLAVVAEIALFLRAGLLLDRFAPPSLIVFTLAVTAVRWAATAAAEQQVIVVAIQLGHTVTFSVFHLAAIRLLARLVPAESTTTGQALYGLVGQGLGGGLGVALAGAFTDRIGTPRLFGIEALIAAAGIMPALALRRSGRPAPA